MRASSALRMAEVWLASALLKQLFIEMEIFESDHVAESNSNEEHDHLSDLWLVAVIVIALTCLVSEST